MVKPGEFGILGDGAQARETADFALPRVPRFRAVSSEYLDTDRSDLIGIATTDHDLLDVPVVAAVGAPGARRDIVALWGGTAYFSVFAPSSWISDSARLGDGAIVAPQAVVGTGVTAGDHLLVNIGASISHDTRLGNYVTVSPGVRIAGNCVIEDGVFLGIGAVVSQRVSIAAGSVIGAGAVVVRNIAEPGLYVGVPARRIRIQEEWARAI